MFDRAAREHGHQLIVVESIPCAGACRKSERADIVRFDTSEEANRKDGSPGPSAGPLDVVILDVDSEFGAGIQNLHGFRGDEADVCLIAVTDHVWASKLIPLINEYGLDHCVSKPVTMEALGEAIAHVMRRRAIKNESRVATCEAVAWTRFLETRVTKQSDDAFEAFEDTLRSLVAALDARENESADHSRRVALNCLFFAVALGIDPAEYEAVYYGAFLHDIGKIGISDGVLLKAGRLTAEERRQIESHVDIGAGLLGEIRRLRSVLDIPRYHHERYDGTGYPEGLAGNAIPLPARLFALIDVYDALRSARPYKEAWSHKEALRIIRQGQGRHFDPDLVDRFSEISETTWIKIAGQAGKVLSFTDAMLVCHHAMTG